MHWEVTKIEDSELYKAKLGDFVAVFDKGDEEDFGVCLFCGRRYIGAYMPKHRGLLFILGETPIEQNR